MTERNKIISAINKVGGIMMLGFLLIILIIAVTNRDTYNRITGNYTEVHDWKNHVERELGVRLKGYVPYE